MTSAPLPPPPPAEPTATGRSPLRRSSTDRMVGGVCGGLAQHLGIDALLWRVAFVALALAGGSGVLLYLALWVLVPPPARGPQEPVPPLDQLAERLGGLLRGSAARP